MKKPGVVGEIAIQFQKELETFVRKHDLTGAKNLILSELQKREKEFVPHEDYAAAIQNVEKATSPEKLLMYLWNSDQAHAGLKTLKYHTKEGTMNSDTQRLTEGRKSSILKMLSQMHAYLSRYDDLDKAEEHYKSRCEELGCSDIYAVLDDVLDAVAAGKKADKARLLNKVYKAYFPKVAKNAPASEGEIEQAIETAEDVGTSHPIDYDNPEEAAYRNAALRAEKNGEDMIGVAPEDDEGNDIDFDAEGYDARYRKEVEGLKEAAGDDEEIPWPVEKRIRDAEPDEEGGEGEYFANPEEEEEDFNNFHEIEVGAEPDEFEEDACPNCGTPYEEFLSIEDGWECPNCGEQFFDDEEEELDEDDFNFDIGVNDAEVDEELDVDLDDEEENTLANMDMIFNAIPEVEPEELEDEFFEKSIDKASNRAKKLKENFENNIEYIEDIMDNIGSTVTNRNEILTYYRSHPKEIPTGEDTPEENAKYERVLKKMKFGKEDYYTESLNGQPMLGTAGNTSPDPEAAAMEKTTALLNAAKVLSNSQDSNEKRLGDDLVKGLVQEAKSSNPEAMKLIHHICNAIGHPPKFINTTAKGYQVRLGSVSSDEAEKMIKKIQGELNNAGFPEYKVQAFGTPHDNPKLGFIVPYEAKLQEAAASGNEDDVNEEIDWDDIPFKLQKKIAKLEKMIDPDGDGGLLEPEEREEIQAELDKLYAPYVKKAASKGKKNESVLKAAAIRRK